MTDRHDRLHVNPINIYSISTNNYLLQVYYCDVRNDAARGVATDMASLDAAYFLSQVTLSAIMGYVVHVTGTVLAYVITAAAVGAVSCACIMRIIVDKKDVSAMFRT